MDGSELFDSILLTLAAGYEASNTRWVPIARAKWRPHAVVLLPRGSCFLEPETADFLR
jgi:hypothetical protein